MYVAPIQTASALPFFVLGLPAGAIGCPLDSSFVLISMARPRMFDDTKTTRGPGTLFARFDNATRMRFSK
jgi:hypothetical protein